MTFYGGLSVAALVTAPPWVGIALLALWLVAVFRLTRDPARVLFTALVVGGAAALLRDVAGLSSDVLVVSVTVVGCIAIYGTHDRER